MSALREVVGEIESVGVFPGMTHVPVPVRWLERLAEAAAAEDAAEGPGRPLMPHAEERASEHVRNALQLLREASVTVARFETWNDVVRRVLGLPPAPKPTRRPRRKPDKEGE
jgi:hypothetical protein